MIACVQMSSGPNLDANLFEAERLIVIAAEQGAKLVLLPENFAFMGMQEVDKIAVSETYGDGVIQNFLAQQAVRNKIWIAAGTIPIKTNNANKVRASFLLYDDHGEVQARYDKMHLFDVHVTGTDEHYNESETIEPGDTVVVVDTPLGKIGMAVCYDLRFPELYRSMIDQGMELLLMPSAFTAYTGKSHWEPLVRCRAIENQCYVAAAAQGGYHINGRETYGDSMIVDPWGSILERLPHGSGVICAPISSELLSNTRNNFPSIAHRRLRCG